MPETSQLDFDFDHGFDYDLDVSKDFDVDVKVEFDTDVKYESDYDVDVKIDVDTKIEGNFAGFNVDVQAIGEDTAVEVNLLAITTDKYSSISVSGYSASGTKNDAPDAANDIVYVEMGDVKTFAPLANDDDPDGSIIPSSLVITDPPNFGGATVHANGTITYDDTIPPTGADDTKVDTLTYSVTDDEGATGTANVTVNVIDPLSETHTDTDTGGNGQALTLSLTTEDRTANTTSFASVDITSGDVQQKGINVAFIYDASGSVGQQQYDEQIEAIQDAINALRLEYAGFQNTIQVQLIRFASGSDASQIYTLNDDDLDNIAALSITDYIQGTTNYEAALDDALDFFAATSASGEANFVLFASDGMPNTPNDTAHLDEADDLKDIASVTAVGFGNAVTEATLDVLDNTGGAQVVDTAEELGDVFANSPLFGATLLDFSLTRSVNGGPAVEVADESDLTPLGGGDYSLDLAAVGGLDGSIGGVNVFTATALFDIDGNAGTTDDQITLTATNTVQGAVPDAYWV